MILPWPGTMIVSSSSRSIEPAVGGDGLTWAGFEQPRERRWRRLEHVADEDHTRIGDLDDEVAVGLGVAEVGDLHPHAAAVHAEVFGERDVGRARHHLLDAPAVAQQLQHERTVGVEALIQGVFGGLVGEDGGRGGEDEVAETVIPVVAGVDHIPDR
jgi:hypothetical protein